MFQFSRTSFWCLVCVEGWGALSTLHLWARLKAEEKKKKKKSGMHVLEEHKTKGMSKKSAGTFSLCECVCAYARVWELQCMPGWPALCVMCKACGLSANMAIMKQKLSYDCWVLSARVNAAVIFPVIFVVCGSVY